MFEIVVALLFLAVVLIFHKIKIPKMAHRRRGFKGRRFKGSRKGGRRKLSRYYSVSRGGIRM